MGFTIEHMLVIVQLVFRFAMVEDLRRIDSAAGLGIFDVACAVDAHTLELVFRHVVDLQNSK